MNYEKIEAFAALLRDSPTLTEIEVKNGEGVSLRLRRAAPKPPSRSAAPLVAGEPEALRAAPVPVAGSGELSKAGTTALTATVVGIFRVMGGAATLTVGDPVKAGQVMGQIEAMRLLNDCISPLSGVVTAAAVEEGQPVEYGQLLFEIKASGE
ncbi:MAG: biotin/lipoyl-binding protein [Cytophagales bacterium]|nr:biotin/lipoyl-binding protein [Armatimonadota bacterium]